MQASALSAELADIPAASRYRHVARLVNAGVLAVAAWCSQPRLANPPAPGRKRRIPGTVLLPGEEHP